MKTKLAFVLLLLAGAVVGQMLSSRFSTAPLGATSQAPVPVRPMPATAGLPDLSPVAERALKVAANISSTTMTVINDPISRFFNGGDLMQPSQSLGSGVVVSSDGYILTNNHVIGGARADIRVTLSDKREFQGKLIGSDDVTDLAVVKIDARDLPTLPWGDSDKLRIAEWVLAIGNPFQLSGTVTLGIISTVSRSGAQVGAFKDLIQTDAAINPGNSGGALINARGELVGINSMIYTETGGYQGIGFAIPSNVAQGIMKELIAHGEVPWGSIGEVVWMNIDRGTAAYNGLGDFDGVYIRNLARTSSAARAGLRPRDIIVSINSQRVMDADQLNRTITGLKAGETIKLDVIRNRQHVMVSVDIVSRRQPAGR